MKASIWSGPGLLAGALLWLCLGAGAYFSVTLSLVWIITGLCFLPALALDAVLLLVFRRRYTVERNLPFTLAQGEPLKVLLRIRGKGGIPLRLRIFDLYPALMDCAAFPALLKTRKGDFLEFSYTLFPRERGAWVFPGLEFLYTSPLFFWRLKVFSPCQSRGRTFPDFKKLMAGKALRGLLEYQGLRDIRRRGQGLEFRDLREYQEGDPVKSIDWRATARQRAPNGAWRFIVREYQEEQDQQVLCILDTGYRLRGPEFDAALEGTMLLSYTALKFGDAAAVMSFGSQERWVPPRKGLHSFSVIMNRLYDLQSSSAPSSPFSALENALVQLRRRTFIILISNFREEDGPSLSWILPRLRQKHLLLLVSFRETGVERLARRSTAELFGRRTFPLPENVLESAAAFSYLATRKRLYQSWEQDGLLTMEGVAENFSSVLVNRYLEIKRGGKL
ncbi:MAG: DUF58 domain-containing protein [Treponema sp.]|nr:DUF58 domain-containing protein [Treponema sp.]